MPSWTGQLLDNDTHGLLGLRDTFALISISSTMMMMLKIRHFEYCSVSVFFTASVWNTHPERLDHHGDGRQQGQGGVTG